ncbi:MAG: DEAD/DEAH box helicase [Planctomycetes bacterium]|nr:DEAD/DEAH box helicase [Planctomycetota bacterium]
MKKKRAKMASPGRKSPPLMRRGKDACRRPGPPVVHHAPSRGANGLASSFGGLQNRETGFSSLLPLVPAGPGGLVYVISAVSPLAGEALVEVFERHVPAGEFALYREELPDWAPLTPVFIDRSLSKGVPDALDRQISSLLTRAPRMRLPSNGKKNGKGIGRKLSPSLNERSRNGNRTDLSRAERALEKGRGTVCLVTEDIWRRLLPLLLETGRVYVERREGGEAVPVVRDDNGAPPCDFHLAIGFGPRTGEFQLTGRFVRNGRTLPPEGYVLLLADGEEGQLLRASGLLSPVAFHGSAAWVKALRRGRFQRVPRRSLPKLYKVFERSTTLPPLQAPAMLNIVTVDNLYPQPELKLDSGPQEAVGEVSFRYGEDLVRAARPGRCFFSPRTNHLIVRKLDLESRHAVQLLDVGFNYDSTTHHFHLTADRLPNAAPELFEFGWSITGKGIPFRPPTDMEVQIDSEPDYIEIAVTVHFGDQSVELPALLEAIQEGNRMIPLGRGVIGVLPYRWLEKNAAWMALGEVYGDRLRFRRTQSSVVDALLSENIKTRLDAGFKAERERLAGFKGIEPASPSPNFNGVLREYQKLGVGWLRFLDQMGWGGCLADDMGLGKTIQALAFLQLLKEEGQGGTTLVVTPKSLVFNWMREAQRFTPNLKTLAYTGQKRAAYFDQLDEYDLVITTYGTVRRDIEKLAGFKFFCMILDEGQAIKNPESQNARAAMLLSGDRRLILSGTPLENHLGELWSLFNFLNPGMLGSADAFRKRFGTGREMDSAQFRYLRRALGPFILRRKKEDVAKDLPEKIEETILCEMEPEQKKIYQRVKDHCRRSVLATVKTKGVARSKLHILEALLRMRQAACHPNLIQTDGEELASGKFQALRSMLDEVIAEGHKVLIFSQFTSLLALLRKELDAEGIVYEYLDGQTVNRQDHVDRFQSDRRVKTFLISLKAGGLGLNLTAADYVFILDPWWNPAVETQAIDRAHRIGQNKKVFAYRFVAEDTIEEKIAELQESKKKLADAIVAGSETFLRDLTGDQLEFLFK